MALFIVEGAAALAGGRWTATFTSPDGQDAFGVLESIAPPGNAVATSWPAVRLDPPDGAPTGGDLFVVEERFHPPVDLSTAAPENPKLSPCLQRHDVDWVVSYIAADGTQCRCVYRAPDAEAVRAAYRSAGMPFSRVWRARTSGAAAAT